VSVELRVTDDDGLLATESAQILVLVSGAARVTTTAADRQERTTREDESGAPSWMGAIGTLVLVFLLVVLIYHRRE